MIPANDILLFISVVRHKSFTLAAKKGGMTPAAMSKRMVALEKMIGVELLLRSTRALALTEAGQILYERCKDMQGDLQEIIETVQETHKKPKGKIYISSLQNVCNLILPALINDFLAQNQDVEFVIDVETALGALPNIGDYDIAFRSGRQTDSSAISRLLFSHNYMICASPLYLKKYGTPKKLDELSNHNCVDCRHGLNNRETNYWTFYDDREEITIAVKSSIKTNNALLVKHLALNHAAIILSPSFIVAEEINQGKLIPLLKEHKSLENSIYVIHPYTSKKMPKRIRSFLEFIFDHISIPTIDEN